jgi:hypothetical protein
MLGPLDTSPSLCLTCTWRCAVAAAAFRRAGTLRAAQRREASIPCFNAAARQHRAKASRLLTIRAHYWDSLAWQLLERVERPRAQA